MYKHEPFFPIYLWHPFQYGNSKVKFLIASMHRLALHADMVKADKIKRMIERCAASLKGLWNLDKTLDPISNAITRELIEYFR